MCFVVRAGTGAQTLATKKTQGLAPVVARDDRSGSAVRSSLIGQGARIAGVVGVTEDDRRTSFSDMTQCRAAAKLRTATGLLECLRTRPDPDYPNEERACQPQNLRRSDKSTDHCPSSPVGSAGYGQPAEDSPRAGKEGRRERTATVRTRPDDLAGAPTLQAFRQSCRTKESRKDRTSVGRRNGSQSQPPQQFRR